MNRKTIILLIIAFSIIFVALVGFYGVKPFNDNPVQATYIKWQNEELSIDDNGKVYYYLPCVEENETKRVYLANFVVLDSAATLGKETLKYSIIYDKEEEKGRLELTETGTFAGWLTIKGQTTATITVSTTDGSGIDARLFIRNKTACVIPGEVIGGDIFK